MPLNPPETAETVNNPNPVNNNPEKKKKKKSKKTNYENFREKFSAKRPGGRPIPKLRCGLFLDHVENVKSKIQDKAKTENTRPATLDRFGKTKPKPQDRKFAPVFSLAKQRKVKLVSSQRSEPKKNDDVATLVVFDVEKLTGDNKNLMKTKITNQIVNLQNSKKQPETVLEEANKEKKEEEAATPATLETNKEKNKRVYKFACQDIRYMHVSCLKVALPPSPSKPKHRTVFGITKDNILENLDTKKWTLVGCGTYASWLFGGRITDENLTVLNSANDEKKEDFKNAFVVKALVKSKLASILFNKDENEYKHANLYDYIRSKFAADFLGDLRSVRMNFTKADGRNTYIIILSKSSAKIPALVYLFDEIIKMTKMNELEQLARPTKKDVAEIWDKNISIRNDLDRRAMKIGGNKGARKISDEENKEFFGY